MKKEREYMISLKLWHIVVLTIILGLIATVIVGWGIILLNFFMMFYLPHIASKLKYNDTVQLGLGFLGLLFGQFIFIWILFNKLNNKTSFKEETEFLIKSQLPPEKYIIKQKAPKTVFESIASIPKIIWSITKTIFVIVLIVAVISLFIGGYYVYEAYINNVENPNVVSTNPQSSQIPELKPLPEIIESRERPQLPTTGSKTITFYIEPLPYGVDEKYRDAVIEAFALWSNTTNIAFKETSGKTVEIYVSWVKEFGERTLGHTLFRKFIEVGLGDSLCLGKWKPYRYVDVVNIAGHEIGHALGLEDNYDNPNLLMYYQHSPKYEVAINETVLLGERFLKFFPICSRDKVANVLFEVSSERPLNIFIVPSSEALDLLAKGQTFSHYPDCKGENVAYYIKNCTIDANGGLLLENLDYTNKVWVRIREI
jgi:hypothetical protein